MASAVFYPDNGHSLHHSVTTHSPFRQPVGRLILWSPPRKAIMT